MGRRSPEPKASPYAMLAPFGLVFLVFTLIPLVGSLALATTRTFGPEHVTYVGGGNFSFMLRDPLFWTAVRNTAVFTVASVCVQLPCSLGLALILNKNGLPGRAFFRLVFFMPVLVGTVFAALMFQPILESHTGLLNRSIHAVVPAFDPAFPWLERHVMLSLIIASLWMYTGFNMVYFLAALQNVSKDLVEAAKIDGAGPVARFVHVTLPAIRPVGSFVVLTSVIGSVQLFELPFIMLGGAGPESRGLTVVMYLYQTGFQTGDLGYASAIGWALAVVLAIAAVIQLLASGDRT